MRVPAIFLAGGQTKGDLREACGVEETAMIELAGRPMVSYVLDGLAEAETIGEILVVGLARVESAALNAGVRFELAGDSLLDNVLRGIEALQRPAEGSEPQDFALLSTCDLPFLTGCAVDAFVRASLDTGAQFCYPVVARELCQAKYPDARRTWVKLRDGVVTGGNLALASRKFLLDNQVAIRDFFAARKSPLRLALLIGPLLALKLAFRRAAIAEIERRVERMLGFKAKAIVCSHPEIGMDVDKVADWELVRRLLETPPDR